jgi:hypothetical protein
MPLGDANPKVDIHTDSTTYDVTKEADIDKMFVPSLQEGRTVSNLHHTPV